MLVFLHVMVISTSTYIVLSLCYWFDAKSALYDQLPEADVNDEMIRMGVWDVPYSFRDVQGLLLHHRTLSTRQSLPLGRV